MKPAHIRAAMTAHGISTDVIESIFECAADFALKIAIEAAKQKALLILPNKSNGSPYATNSNAVRQQRFKRKKREKSTVLTLETAKTLKFTKVQ